MVAKGQVRGKARLVQEGPNLAPVAPSGSCMGTTTGCQPSPTTAATAVELVLALGWHCGSVGRQLLVENDRGWDHYCPRGFLP